MSAVSCSIVVAQMAAWLEKNGVDVDLHASGLPDHVVGRYYDGEKRIAINTPKAATALLALAHEAGHWLGYQLFPGPETPSGTRSSQREDEAFRNGWSLLVAFGATHLVTLRTWRKWHGRRSGKASPSRGEEP